MAATARNLTEGKPSVLILRFALPMMAGSVFQQLYTITDAAIVGKFLGVQALAAIGAADWFNWLVLSIIIGFAQGFAIIPAQRFGAGDRERLRRSAAMGIALTGVLALLLTAGSLPSIAPVLRIMHTEAAIFGDAEIYLVIVFSGIPIVAGYNIFSSLLRSLGDSRDPLVAMVVGAVTNIGLDLLFVVVLHRGVAGAAAATVIGQGCALLYSLAAFLRAPEMRFRRADWLPDWRLVRREFLLGLPMALQNAVIGVGGMAVQQVVNGFGYVFVAGFTATNKLYGLLELAATNFGYAVASYTGQNLGAGKYGRIRSGVRDAARMGVLTSLAVAAVMLLAGRWIVALFISAEDGAGPERPGRGLPLSGHHVRAAVHPLFTAYLPLLPPGHGRHGDPLPVRHLRAGHAPGHRPHRPRAAGPGRVGRLYRRAPGVAGGGPDPTAVLLPAYAEPGTGTSPTEWRDHPWN